MLPDGTQLKPGESACCPVTGDCMTGDDLEESEKQPPPPPVNVNPMQGCVGPAGEKLGKPSSNSKLRLYKPLECTSLGGIFKPLPPDQRAFPCAHIDPRLAHLLECSTKFTGTKVCLALVIGSGPVRKQMGEATVPTVVT